jgi:hypothetical protein
VEAVRWWRKAAEQGHFGAQGRLALAHASGQGAPRNLGEAYFWANLSTVLVERDPEGRHREQTEDIAKVVSVAVRASAEMRDEIGAKLSKSQLLAVQKRCRQWLEAFERRKAKK